jgi:hypothetical protein
MSGKKIIDGLEEALERTKRGEFDAPAPRAWKDPTCPKCGIVLGNRMSYACGQAYCPSGLN